LQEDLDLHEAIQSAAREALNRSPSALRNPIAQIRNWLVNALASASRRFAWGRTFQIVEKTALA
jgi:hypothetical protein